jgi:phage tail protein X
MSSPLRDTQIVQAVVAATPGSKDLITQIVQGLVVHAPTSKDLVTQVVQVLVVGPATIPVLGGIYKIVPGKSSDTLYTGHDPVTTIQVKFPDPSATMLLQGDE